MTKRKTKPKRHRLTDTEALVLVHVNSARSWYVSVSALDLVHSTSGELDRAKIHVQLQRMVTKGLLTAKKDPKAHCRVYSPTPVGILALRAHRAWVETYEGVTRGP